MIGPNPLRCKSLARELHTFWSETWTIAQLAGVLRVQREADWTNVRVQLAAQRPITSTATTRRFQIILDASNPGQTAAQPSMAGRPKWTNVQLRTCKTGHFTMPGTSPRVCSSAAILARGVLGYGGLPFTTPEVPMSNLKCRMYPFLFAAVGVFASVGGAFRLG
jgi:hypothetical protein